MLSLLEKRIGLITPTPIMSVLEIIPTCRDVQKEGSVSILKRRCKKK
jgi:hypothetical protein